MKIDLHGVKHAEVSRKLDVFLWNAMQRGNKNVEVITGISHKMKELVKETCKDYGFNVIDLHVGSLLVEI
jgi:hypothetical protein